MKLQLVTIATLFLSATGQDLDCKEVETVENFNLTQYASAPWYIHEQAVTQYSPLEQNFCTSAEYTIRDSKSFWGYTVDVQNTAQDSMGGIFGGPLCAFQQDESPSKLAVAPCWLPKVAAGPYWVVAYDESEGYALISGGQPEIKGENGGCRTGTGTNNAGLWIFSRSQERDEELVEKVRGIAETAGFDLSVLNKVVQDECLACEDTQDTFRFWGYQRDCDWVARSSNFWKNKKCLFNKISENCPSTCDKC